MNLLDFAVGLLVAITIAATFAASYGGNLHTPKTVPLWQVWLGPHPVPPTTAFALATCSNLHRGTPIKQRVVTSDSIKEWLEVHDAFYELDFVEQSDYLRIELLHKYGGFWLDADVVCLNPLARLAADVAVWDVSGARNKADYMDSERGTVFSQNALGPIKAGTAITAKWHKQLWDRMDRLAPQLARCTAPPYAYPRHVGTSLCGIKWGELVDFVNDDLWPLQRKGQLGFGLTLCDQEGSPLGFSNAACDAYHMGMASGHAARTIANLCALPVLSSSFYANSCCAEAGASSRKRVPFALDFAEAQSGLDVRCFSKRPSGTIVVTALWDIKRATKGDGRPFAAYIEWLQKTLQLNAAMMLFAEAATIEKVRPARDATGFPTCYVAMRFEDHPYYRRFFDANKEIVTSASYRKHVQHPRRVEVVNPSYNILQWGKIELMRRAVELDPFDSQYVVWFDAGISRFMQISPNAPTPYISQETVATMAATGSNLYISIIKDSVNKWNAWRHACKKNPLELTSLNLFAGTAMMAKADRIAPFEAHWASFVEKTLKGSSTAQDQLMLQMMWCEHPNEIQPIIVKDTHEFMGFHEALHGSKSYYRAD